MSISREGLLYAAMFIVVVAVLQMPLCVASATRHGPYGQHSPTVTLFEIRMQWSALEKQGACRDTCRHVATHRGVRGPILQARIEHGAPNCRFATLVLKIDTIPKPDGLGERWHTS